MATRHDSAIIQRVWSRLPEGSRTVLETELSPLICNDKRPTSIPRFLGST